MGQNSIGVIFLFYFIFLSYLLVNDAAKLQASKNQIFLIKDLCNETHRKPYNRMIEGSLLVSEGERNLECIITFQTDTILQNFMLRFEKLHLDCNDHLYIYDGAHTTSTHKADLSCRNTLLNVGTIFTHSNYITLKYVTDQWGPSTNGFKLIITAFKREKISCSYFRCKKTNFCVHSDLTCDGVNHCGDRSDESTSFAHCPAPPIQDILGYPGMMLVLVIISVVLVFCICGVAAIVCVYRRNRNNLLRRQQEQQVTAAFHSDYGVDVSANKFGTNGIGSSYSTLIPQQEQQQQTVVGPLGSRQGNLGRPASGVGCSTLLQPTPPTGLCWRRGG